MTFTKIIPSRLLNLSIFLSVFLAAAIFVVLVSKQDIFHSLSFASSQRAHSTSAQRPLIIYTKPRKTGSTFISSMLGNAVLRAGGRIAPCKVASIMTPDAPHYGLVRSYDLLGCHKNLNAISVSALRGLPRDVVFVTSTREPFSWFLSAAVWVYERQNGVRVESAQLLKKAIDYALEGGQQFVTYRAMFLADHGLKPSSTASEVADITNIYSYVFDHATAEEDVNRALVQLGYATSSASSRREGVYDTKWVAEYRTENIRNVTRLEKVLYDRLMEVRQAHLEEHAGWANPNAKDVKTFYSAARMSISGRG